MNYYDLVEHLEKQHDFSLRTFGPGKRTKGLIDHIQKELREIECDPADLTEWIDVIMLGLDGAWRAGFEPQEIAQELHDKLERNKARDWPDWRTADPDKAIEHVRSAEPMKFQVQELRPEVLAFALLMEERLRDKDADKGQSWKGASHINLEIHATSKMRQIELNVDSNPTRHAVDLANYCMMIADVAGGLDAEIEALAAGQGFGLVSGDNGGEGWAGIDMEKFQGRN
jgi:hypothetical protein